MLFVFSVVYVVIALAGAVAAFGAVARLKFLATDFASARRYALHTLDDVTFTLQTNRRVAVNPFLECAHPRNGADVEHPRFRAGSIVFAKITPVDSMPPTKRRYFCEQHFPPGNRHPRMQDSLRNMDAPIAIEHAAHEMVCVARRNVCVAPQHAKSFSEPCGTHAYGHRMRPLSDCVRRINGLAKFVDVPSILHREAEHDCSGGRVPVCVQKAKPVGFCFGIYGVEKCVIN